VSSLWYFFPSQFGEHQASIFYDHGIGETINQLAGPLLLRVRVPFKTPRPDGLSSSEEFKALMAIEDDLQELVNRRASLYVGRVTVDGKRDFYIYTAGPDTAWSSDLVALGERHDYVLNFSSKLDEKREGYWKGLFPNDAEWQVIQDLGVLDTLEKQGDDGSASRQIDHWAYFVAVSDADLYRNWLLEQAYRPGTASKADDGRYCVHFSHDGTVRLQAITSHTIPLAFKARELRGEYNGWEAPVCKNI
jgi:hypothetical protein